MNSGPREEVLLAVEPDRHSRRDPAAAARALLCGRLADGLDREPLHLGPRRPPADPGKAGVDHAGDAGNGQRGLGDVGGEYDATPGVPLEDAMLLGRGESGEQRHDVEATWTLRLALEHVLGVPDLALPREEDEDVAGSVGQQLGDRVLDRLGLVPEDRLALLVVVRLLEQRPVAHLDREGATRDLDDRRRSSPGIGEVLGEALGVDGRRGDDQLQVGPPGQQSFQVPEQEVHVQAALVGLVDDQGVVLLEHPVALQLGEQDAVGHHLHAALLRRTVGEPHLVADRLPQLGAELLGDPLGNAARSDPAWLGVPDHRPTGSCRVAAPEGEADLGQLRGLPGSRLPGDDHHLVVADRLRDVVAACRDRKVGREVDTHSVAILPAGVGHAQPDRFRSGPRGGQRDGVGRIGVGIPGARPSRRCSWRHSRQRSRWRSFIRPGGRTCPSRWIRMCPGPNRPSSASSDALARAAPPSPPRITEMSATATTAGRDQTRSRHPGFGSAAGSGAGRASGGRSLMSSMVHPGAAGCLGS